MSATPNARGIGYYAATGLSLWLGWGIRGNFGHEYGAMMPGALAALAVALMSGRVDWQRRAADFALFGALGWSFGGSISYMQVVAYTHSGDSRSVLYGFACLFVIGFLWAALGGVGTALAALADRRFLSDLYLPMGVVFFLWWLQGAAIEPWLRRQGYELNWYDTDWVAATLAMAGGLIVCVVRRRLDRANGLILAMAAGWWAGFAVLVLGFGLRMTPPRGDNWAGCLGMTLAVLVYCRWIGLGEVARAGLLCGFIGGIGFAAASMLKLVEITSGWQTNWHSILEQTTGLFNGIGLAVAMASLSRWNGPVEDVEAPHRPPATEPMALGFVVLGITYLNLRKNVGQWVNFKAMPPEMGGLAASTWFDLGYLLAALTLLALLVRHARRPLAIVPESPMGRGQLLYLVLLWWLVVGNFERALVAFAPQRLVTEGVLYVVALLCTLLLLAGPPEVDCASATPPKDRARPGLALTIAGGLLASAISIAADWAIVRKIYGDRYAGAPYARKHIRFGPNATIHRTEDR
ncbi:MAG: hypothetical protein ACLQGP_19125 [Isosphaeraceae bacterium]